MITQAITDSLTSIQLDLTTVSGLFFMAFLAIYFFVAVKPGIDSKRRVNRQVRRRLENDIANQLYFEKSNTQNRQVFKSGGGTIPTQKTGVQRQSKNNGYYKKDKGYQAYLKRNSTHLVNKQVVKKAYFKRATSLKKGLI